MTEPNDIKGKLDELIDPPYSMDTVTYAQKCEAFFRTHGARLKRALEDVERIDWLEAEKGLHIECVPFSPWTRKDGSTFVPRHLFRAGETQFEPRETLREVIDAARASEQTT